MPSEPLLLRTARWCAFGSAASVLLSIAVSQTLLALSVAALLMSGARLRLPRIWLPLTLFLLGTLISLALSENPGAGLPQVRKIYVFLQLLVVFSTFDLVWTRRLFWAWAAAGALSGTWACVQFARKLAQAQQIGRPFYDYYMTERVSGFMSHWNTFSAHMMFVVLFVVSFLLFASGVRGIALWGAAALGAVSALGMVLALTRIVIFMACPVAILYLVWWWRRWLVAVLPLLALAGLLVAPPFVKQRFNSIFHPRQDVDSNEFRRVTFSTGLEMIKAHPWFGLGPELPKALFDQYLPPGMKKPTGWYGHLHSIYIHYAAERGIPATLALVWMLLQMWYDFWRGARKLPPGRNDARFVLHAAAAVVIAVILEGFFELNLGDSEVLAMFLAVTGGGYAALEKARA
jgi:putative inorganic carbon (hco3(-)) transporter